MTAIKKEKVTMMSPKCGFSVYVCCRLYSTLIVFHGVKPKDKKLPAGGAQC